MSRADERRAEQDAYDRDQQQAMNERQSEPTAPYIANPKSWAGECPGWRVGIHERTRENRLAGVYKCRWCGQSFDVPTPTELDLMRERSLAYSRPFRVSSRQG